MKAYKAFNNDWTCNNFKFEVGKTYKHDGPVKLCSSGFHACLVPSDLIKYYDLIQYNKFAEVECVGDIEGPEKDCSKIACREITIIRELSFDSAWSASGNRPRSRGRYEV